MVEGQFDIKNLKNPELCREVGKQLYFAETSSKEERDIGLQLLVWATEKNDPEARFIFGCLLFSGKVVSGIVGGRRHTPSENAEEGLKHIQLSAAAGYLRARIFLDKCTNEKYAQEFYSKGVTEENAPLKDFDGKPFVIKRTGRFTPIDAKLTFEGGKNILTLSANIVFWMCENTVKDLDRFCDAVIEGFQAWTGEYRVFGNQALTVKVDLTEDKRLFDNVYVVPMPKGMQQSVQSLVNKFGAKKAKERARDIIEQKRSFAVSGIKKWSVHSRKFIYILSDNDAFDDYEEIKAVAKHEFGHALGLGDLYCSESDALDGVQRGTYRELDSYSLGQKNYNLVMCDHHGPISNNDIEMIILAFSENRVQNYQKNNISKALGRGN